MAEPSAPSNRPAGVPASPRSPFNPPQAPSSPRTGGPGKPLVIGCLVVLVLAGVGLIASLYYAGQNYDRIFSWSLGRIRDGVQERLPKDLSAEERQRLDAAFTAAQSGAGASRANPAASGKLQSLMLDLAHESEGTGPLSRKQVEEITGTLEKIGELGRTGKPPAAPPS
jgi:hypothetical protein